MSFSHKSVSSFEVDFTEKTDTLEVLFPRLLQSVIYGFKITSSSRHTVTDPEGERRGKFSLPKWIKKLENMAFFSNFWAYE